MKIGDNIKVKDLTLGKLETTQDPNSVIVLVKTARGAMEEEIEEEEGEEGEEGAAPEGEAAEESKAEE